MNRKKVKVICLTTMLCFFILFTSCTSTNRIDYYSKRDNYITATGMVRYISYSEDNLALYLDFEELTPTFDDTCFKIVGKNLSIVQGNGINDKVKEGIQIEFITAPRYFGDGYVMPIVAISVEGESLLEFEEGFTNLLIWLKEK